MKELVLKVYWGGLGDHLLYSPIPRLAKKHGYGKVFISNKSAYRNPNTKKLVWEYNPFIDGFTDGDSDYPKFSEVPEGSNILDEIARFFGLPDDGSRYKRPEIHYQPKLIPELKDAVLFDPNSINKSGVPTIQETEDYFERKEIKVTHQMESLYGSTSNRGRIEVRSRDLEHYCDMIVSCKSFFCYTTGAATLADALQKQTNVLYVPGIKPMFHHSQLHVYTNVGGFTC